MNWFLYEKERVFHKPYVKGLNDFKNFLWDFLVL